MTTLAKIAWLNDHGLYSIHFRNAGVGMTFYEGPPEPDPRDPTWKLHLVIHRYYPTLAQAAHAEYRRIQRASA